MVLLQHLLVVVTMAAKDFSCRIGKFAAVDYSPDIIVSIDLLAVATGKITHRYSLGITTQMYSTVDRGR